MNQSANVALMIPGKRGTYDTPFTAEHSMSFMRDSCAGAVGGVRHRPPSPPRDS